MYQFREVQYEDIFIHMKIRNEQLEILRHREPVTEEHQMKWYKNVIIPSQQTDKPTTKIFTILYDGRVIGNGGLCYIDYENMKAEFSFIVEKERQGEQFENDFKAYITYIKEYGFKKLGLHRIYAEVYDFRKHLINLFFKEGFEFEGTLRDNVKMYGTFHDAYMFSCLS
jgi:RimJ/RimL family protein N-acetyltransferase